MKKIFIILFSLAVVFGGYWYSRKTLASVPQTTYSFTAVENNTVAYDLLRSKVDVTTKDYGEAGLFVESINGLAADKAHYWAFYVKNIYAEQGISKTILQKGDTMEFKYETINQ